MYIPLSTKPLSKTRQQGKPKVAVAIPCFKTNGTIRDVVSKTKKHIDHVIVVDDGSNDGTAKSAVSAGAFVIIHAENQGKGAAMMTAAKNTDADIIVFLDGDGQNDPGDIPRLIAPIVEGAADLVIGSRHLPDSKVIYPAFNRRLANTTASLVISAIISILLPLATFLNRLIHPVNSNRRSRPSQGSKKTPNNKRSPATYRLVSGRFKWITDCTSGFRAIRRTTWQSLGLSSRGFQIETEMIYEAARNKFMIAEVPISCNWNSRISNLSVVSDGWKTVKLLAKKLMDDVRGR